MLLRWVVSIVSDILVQDSPETLNGVDVWAIWRKRDEMDPAVRPCRKIPDIRAFVTGCIVPEHMPEHMNDALVGVAVFDPGQKLRGTGPIDSGWFDKGRIEGLKIERPMNVDASTPCCAEHCGV